MTTAILRVPPKLIPIFTGPARYRGAYGGRGSGKTRTFALMAAVRGYMLAEAGKSGVIVCGREFQNSLDESSMAEVKAAIASVDWLADYYEVGERYIRTRNRRIDFAFIGLRHNLDSVKSKALIHVLWVDEAESVTESAWRKVVPTVREEGSEIWATWNPESPDSATHRRFRSVATDNMRIAKVNWDDNPWFPAVLDQERRDDLKYRADTYGHVWEGDFYSETEAQVFHGKWRVDEFTPETGWDGPYQGIDFGFRPDPLCALRVWVHDRKVWIEYEAYGTGVEIDATAKFIKDRIPGFANHVARADSAEPKTISYLSRSGLPRIEPVRKWPNSVLEGVRYLRGFESIVIHPRCPNTARDFRLYSHKSDRLTGDIMTDLLDADNHAPDTLRYALAPLIKAITPAQTTTVAGLF